MAEPMPIPDEEIISAFHATWDRFPGLARLIRSDHVVLAANPFAEAQGFTEGACCAKVGDPKIHRMCGLSTMMKEHRAVTDSVIPGRVRGWVPVDGRDDLCVHFAVFVPEEGQRSIFEG